MSNKLELRRLKKGIGNVGKTKPKGYFAVMGKLDGTVLTGVGNRVYVTALSDGHYREVINRRNVPNRAGLVVFVGSDEYSANRIEVLFELGSEGSSNNGVTPVNSSIPPHNHSWPGSNTTWVFGQQFMPLLAKPIAGTLTIQIYPGAIRKSGSEGWIFISDQIVDVSGDVPASDALWITLQANDDGSVDYVVGSTNVTRASLDEGDIPEATTGQAIWAVILEAGYNELFQNTVRNDFLDLRFDGAINGTLDAVSVTYTPLVLADWDYLADPGDLDNALDQLAARVADLEVGGVFSITQISSQTLTGDGSFSNVTIPSGYDEIWVKARIRTADAGATDRIGLRLGTSGSLDTGTNYAYTAYWQGASSGGVNDASTATYISSPVIAGNGAAANYFGEVEFKIIFPGDTSQWKNVAVQGGYVESSGHRTGHGTGVWKNTAAVDILNILGVATATFKSGSRMTVLGISYGS